jgi:hypothetical protein
MTTDHNINPEILKSKNGKIVIKVVPSVEQVYQLPITQTTDFSFVEAPEQPSLASVFYQELHRTQTNNHVTVNTSRQSKNKRLSCFANIRFAEEAGFIFQDFVSILSEKDAKKFPNSLLSFTETVAILSKYDDLNISATEWFNPEQKQATNLWMVEANPKEKPNVSTSRVFTFEVGDLVSSLASPLINRSFSIFGLVNFNYMMYAKLRNYGVYAVTHDSVLAKKAIVAYDSSRNK